MLNHIGTQAIRTERLILRRFVIDDYMDMYVWCSNSEVLRYVCYKKHKSPEDSKEILTEWFKGKEQQK